MALDPNSRRTAGVLTALAVSFTFLAALAAPDFASAAPRSAAGGSDGQGGFARFVRPTHDRLTPVRDEPRFAWDDHHGLMGAERCGDLLQLPSES